jgi:hypothetical protein
MVESRDKTDLHEDHTSVGAWHMSSFVNQIWTEVSLAELVTKLREDKWDKRDSRCENTLISSK